MGRREQKREATRDQLVAAAEALFEERGYDATSVDDVAERADVAKGTFYYHFPTKEDVAVAVARTAMARGSKGLRDEIATLPADEALRRVASVGAEWVEAHPQLARTCLLFAFGQALRGEVPPDGGPSSMRRVLGAIVAAGQVRGELRDDIPAEDMGNMIATLYLQSVLWWTLKTDAPPLVGYLEGFLGVVLDGARRRPPRGEGEP